MLFLPLLLIAIVLYIIGQRVWSVFILLFFLTNGFQLFPLILFETFVGISKPLDFGILYVFSLFGFGLVKYKDFIPKNLISKAIGIFLLFIIISSFVSFQYGQVSISNITRETRYFFFVLAYFILRRLTRVEIDRILELSLYVTVFASFVFSLQPIFSMQILNGYAGQGTIDGLPFLRYYNLPIYNTFFIFFTIFNSAISKMKRISFFSILMIAQLFTMHRSQIAILLMLIILGLLYKYRPKRILHKVALVLSMMVILGAGFLSFKPGGKTSNDIKSVMAGDFIEFNVEEVTAEATLVFRLAHFYERMMVAFETERTTIFGLGFMSEKSSIAVKNFDFFVGMEGDFVGDVIQFDTSDIAWSNFVVRLGVLGTVIYLILYFIFVIRFAKEKRKDISLITLLYMLQLFLASITSSQLYYTWLLIIPILIYIYIVEKTDINEEPSDNNHNTIV